MAKIKKRKVNSKSYLDRDLKKVERKIEKEICKDVKEAEKWMIERRKFLIKLAWVIGIIALLLVISNILLTTKVA